MSNEDVLATPGWSGKIGQEELELELREDIEITQYWDASSHVCRFEQAATTNGLIPVVVIDGYA